MSRPVKTEPDGTSPRPRGRPAGRTTADGVIADRDKLLAAAEQLIRSAGPTVSLEAIARAAAGPRRRAVGRCFLAASHDLNLPRAIKLPRVD